MARFDSFLFDWIEQFTGGVFKGPHGADKLADSLSCEELPYGEMEAMPKRDRDMIHLFRGLTQKARIQAAARALRLYSASPTPRETCRLVVVPTIAKGPGYRAGWADGFYRGLEEAMTIIAAQLKQADMERRRK